MEEITPVPLPPHPMMPILIAEFALLPNAMPGLTMVTVERAAVPLINSLRFRCVILLILKFNTCSHKFKKIHLFPEKWALKIYNHMSSALPVLDLYAASGYL